MVVFTVLMLVFAMGVVASAKGFPSKTVTIMVPFSPGGGTDVAARLFAPYLEKYLGTSIAILNKPGSGGEVGFTYLYTQKADGYNIGFTNLPHLVSYPLMRQTKYEVEKFIPIINLVTDPGVIVVKADDDRFPDLDTFINYAKEHPQQITIGNSGIGGDDYIATLLLENKSEAKFIAVPFTGAAPNRTALLGGHIDASAINASEAIQFVESGQMRVLGVMSEKRYADLPDVPTFVERGYEVVSGSSRGISAPPGTPDEIIQILADACEKAANDPEFVEKALKAQQPLDIQMLDDAAKIVERYNNTIKALHEIYKW